GLDTPTLSIGFHPIEFPNQTSKFERKYWNYENNSVAAQPTLISGVLNRSISVSGWQGTDNAVYRFSIGLDDVKFWTEKQPALYTLEVNLTVPDMNETHFDRYTSQVGFREISVGTHELQLNGAPIFLAGNSLHEEILGSGRTIPTERIWDDLLLMQGIHSNLIRSHYTLHPDYYLFGDRLGITFWEELSIYWFSDVSFLETMVRGQAESLFLEMVYRDYNRPSIFFWSVANEPWSEGILLDYLSEFRTLQEIIDPSRILGFAATPTQTHIPAFQDLEMITINLYVRSDDKFNEITSLIDNLVTENPNKPILITEYGKPLDTYIPAFLENPHMTGICHWVGFDYYSNYYLDFDYHWSGSGVYNRDRTSYRYYLPYMNATYANLTLNNP
ncbi:MAG: glycoside hydrolase family 2 TIM barrel-domain containing protein, partial [Promethearchaeota archaeon]